MNFNPPSSYHLHRGKDSERSALEHLNANGLKLLERNYRCAAGELDLVMLDNTELVFVEVRYRRSDRFGGAAQSVDHGKQRKLRRTAERFLQQYPNLCFQSCRFDVVAITGADGDYHIDWISDAF